ncbi:P4 family phage plasmid primase [Lacticaseibacillus saniviri JCM 17471 = DSM 24301]|uniref:p4 family phage plasmid primase n=1 Tax=Lacticaseibacillus saniviri JCM 17471 = DSM 24301 TaxID=1293598 RepID=A0A0R2MN57_9LACO|nr:P4 family phage plasmid primase [Lacticaseibacillus saniviri JCM 17471 = DSM 24301]
MLTPFISKNWGVGRRLVSEWQVSSEYKALVQGFSQCTNGSLEKFREVVSNQYVLDATLERLIFVKPNATGTLDDVDYLMGLFDAALISLERSMFMIEASEASASFQKDPFAEQLRRVLQLVKRVETEGYMVYNWKSGVWVHADSVLPRLIMEIVRYLGVNPSKDWTRNFETSVLEILERTVPELPYQKWNKRWFAFGNVDLDGQTAKIVPHSPKHYVTFTNGLTYGGTEKEPTLFLEFLHEITDDDTVLFLQEFMGYLLTPLFKANAILFMVSSGASGKSVLANIMTILAGQEHTRALPLGSLGGRFDKQALLNAKLSVSTENADAKFDSSSLKALSAGEPVYTDVKNSDPITTVFPTKFVFLFNRLPELSDGSYGMARRLMLIRLTRTFLPEEQDKNLSSKLEEESSLILGWAIEGLRRLIANKWDLHQSPSMKQEVSKYMATANPVIEFTRSQVIKAPQDKTNAADVLNRYKQWLDDKEIPAQGTDSPKAFWPKFSSALFAVHSIPLSKRKSNGDSYVHDITIREE